MHKIVCLKRFEPAWTGQIDNKAFSVRTTSFWPLPAISGLNQPALSYMHEITKMPLGVYKKAPKALSSIHVIEFRPIRVFS